MNLHENYSIFTGKEIIKALELLVSKHDLQQRDVAEAVLHVMGFSQSDIVDQLQRDEYVDGVSKRNCLGLVKM